MPPERDRQLRIAPTVIPPPYALPDAPDPLAPPVMRDTYRQTKFLLGEDLRLFARAMQQQRGILEASSSPRHRTIPFAALALFWSRAYAALRDGTSLLLKGSYSSLPHLARSVAECIAVQGQLHDAEMPEFESWLNNALVADREHQALDLNLGRFRAASRLAEDDRLGAVYRLAGDLSMTPFGGTLLLSASESNQQRLQVAFADQTFHAGFAEIASGWLLRLCERQLACLTAAAEVFNVAAEAADEANATAAAIEVALARPTRCRVEEVTHEGERRYLILNFRRSAAGATRKLLL